MVPKVMPSKDVALQAIAVRRARTPPYKGPGARVRMLGARGAGRARTQRTSDAVRRWHAPTFARVDDGVGPRAGQRAVAQRRAGEVAGLAGAHDRRVGRCRRPQRVVVRLAGAVDTCRAGRGPRRSKPPPLQRTTGLCLLPGAHTRALYVRVHGFNTLAPYVPTAGHRRCVGLLGVDGW